MIYENYILLISVEMLSLIFYPLVLSANSVNLVNSGFTSQCENGQCLTPQYCFTTFFVNYCHWTLGLIEVERDPPLQAALVKLKTAFDSVDKLALWKAQRGIGVPRYLLRLRRLTHRHHITFRVVLQCYDAVGWVIWPVKSSLKIIYNVSSGTLNPTIP